MESDWIVTILFGLGIFAVFGVMTLVADVLERLFPGVGQPKNRKISRS